MTLDDGGIRRSLEARRGTSRPFGVQFVVVDGKPVLEVTGIVDGDSLPTLQRLLDRLTRADFSAATIDLRDAVPIGRGVVEELTARSRAWEAVGKRLELNF